MKVITFSVRTQQPLLATSFEGDPNSDVSYSYIPGSMVRGAVIRRYMKQHGLSELDLAKDDVKRLFFDGNSTCYLNAYLQSNEGKRTLPVPRSWFQGKNAELTDESPLRVDDFSLDRGDELENPKPVGEGFWTTERGSINYYTEKRRINIHNQRDRKKGRSTQGEGEIFRYEAIDSEQTFQAVILCRSETDAQVIRDLLEKSSDIWLGGSQSAGYGHTKITKITNIIDAHAWNEVNIPVDDDDRTDRDFLTVTLLSDLILRDDWGQYAIIPPSTKHEISVPLTRELQKILSGEIQPIRCFTSSTIVGGFNRKWGLPLPTVPALAAGSVFVFELENFSLTPEQIQAIEIKGIGERRTEGFGRVAINWLNQEKFQLKLPNKSSSISLPGLQTDISYTLAAQMAERLLHKKIEKALQTYLGYQSIKGEICNSQLSRLELVAKQAVTTGDCNLVLSLLNNLPPHGSSQFEKAKIGENNQSLKQQLENWLSHPNYWYWVSNKQELKVKVANVERSINDEFAISNKLAEKYTLRLIMALAKKATKEENR
ncbi:type III-D CRISPR-associated RAMP protein Csx10 [Nostoc sp.]|uniref:type III-D CRISPR-associated RAMP protein Csx10 n=1 Tax=Nostoc sp. TaxID=1180 RepID=UPI002FF7F081